MEHLKPPFSVVQIGGHWWTVVDSQGFEVQGVGSFYEDAAWRAAQMLEAVLANNSGAFLVHLDPRRN